MRAVSRVWVLPSGIFSTHEKVTQQYPDEKWELSSR